MPLNENARLDRAARHKIKVLLRALYNHWLAQGVPERRAGHNQTHGHQPADFALRALASRGSPRTLIGPSTRSGAERRLWGTSSPCAHLREIAAADLSRDHAAQSEDVNDGSQIAPLNPD